MAGAQTIAVPNDLQRRILREFRRPLMRREDRGFLWIFLGCATVLACIVALLSSRPVPDYSQREIVRNQERYVKFIGLDVQPVESTEILASNAEGAAGTAAETDRSGDSGETESGEGGGSESGSGTGDASTREMSAVNRQAARMASAGAMRDAISREVSDKGLLRLLTGTGSAVSGSGISNPFNGSQSGSLGGDLDPILASAGGLKTQGESGLGGGNGEGSGLRGSRTGSSTGIDDMVEGLENVTSRSLSRKGELKIESSSDIAGLGRKSIHRSAEAIHEVIIGHQSAIQYCYERELKRFPDLKGKLKVSITIAPDGSVTNASILESSINNERVERCVISRILRWNDFNPIEAGEGDVTVIQSFLFGY